MSIFPADVELLAVKPGSTESCGGFLSSTYKLVPEAPNFAIVAVSVHYIALFDHIKSGGRLIIINLDEGDIESRGHWVGNEPHSPQEVIQGLRFSQDGTKLLVLYKNVSSGKTQYEIRLYLSNSFSENYNLNGSLNGRTPTKGNAQAPIVCPWEENYRPRCFAFSPSLIAISTNADSGGKAVIGLIRKVESVWTFWGHEKVQTVEPDNREIRNKYKGIMGISLY